MPFYHIGKIKRTHKIRGRNTLQCPGLTGLQPGEYGRVQKEQLWLNWTNRRTNLILTSLSPLDFCSDKQLTVWHIIRANILLIVNVILTDEIGMFLNTLIENLEANCKIIIFFGGIINNYWTRLSRIS